MAEKFDIVEYFIDAPAGEPDVLLGSLAARVASNACGVEKCEVSTTCNSFAKPARYQRRARLGDCATCGSEVEVSLIAGRDIDQTIVDIDPVSPGSFMRTEAIAGMEAFWTVVDSVTGPRDVFNIEGRLKIAEAVRANYGDIFPE